MAHGKYYKAHLHMHSCHESSASMEGHMFEARRMGLDAIWFTDHDNRMGKKKNQVVGFDFEDEALIVRDQNVDVEKKVQKKLHDIHSAGVFLDESRWNEAKGQLAESYEVCCGWKQQVFKNPATLEQELTGEKVFKGTRSLKLTAETDCHENLWQQAGIAFFSSGKRHQCSLLSGVKIKIACFIENRLMQDERIIFDVKLSQRPPYHKPARLKYVIGETEGLAEENAAVVKLDVEAGKWNEYCFNLSEDVEKYPVGGQDNVFDTISVILEVRNGKKLTCFVDDFQIESELSFEEVRERQKQLAALLGKKYGILPFVANEISGAGYHKISFCTNVPIIDYYKGEHNVSHAEAVDWVRQHGGIFSINHPFDSWKRIPVNEEERKIILNRTIEKYISSKCDGASMIEIGFPEGRHNFEFRDYMELWDQLSRSGIFITGYGDSDNHTNSENWWDGNNFAVWIYAEKPVEEELTRSMKSGNVFTGDPAIFKGELTFQTAEGYTMGQVVQAEKPEYTLRFEAASVKPDWVVKWIADGVNQRTIKTAGESCKDEIVLKISGKIHFVRIEIYNEAGRCIMLTNPIYFVTGDDTEVPAERKGGFI